MQDWYDMLFGFGVLNLMFGKVVLFSRNGTASMILVIAAAPSRSLSYIQGTSYLGAY